MIDDEYEDPNFAVICPACNTAVTMQVKAEWYVSDQNSGPPQRWSAGHCPQCLAPTLYLRELLGHHPDGYDVWDSHWQVHPPQARKMSVAVPEALRNDHDEARRCLQARCYTAAAIMARRIVEGICREHGYKESLFKALAKMRDAGVIDARLYEWADSARELGNEGAHAYGGSVLRDDAEEVLNFVEALLDYLYVFQARFDAYKKRRDAQKAAPMAVAPAVS